MMDFLMEMGLFSGKVVLITLAIGVILVLFFSLLAKARHSKPLLTIENMNRRFDEMARALKGAVLDAKAAKTEKRLLPTLAQFQLGFGRIVEKTIPGLANGCDHCAAGFPIPATAEVSLNHAQSRHAPLVQREGAAVEPLLRIDLIEVFT